MVLDNNKYLTFVLETEEYAIPIIRVKEIIGMMDITHVPGMPDYVKGVINLRGKIIPVIDLRKKFGFGEREYDDRTCVIVVEMKSGTSEKLSGFVVDTVSEVLDIEKSNIEDPPSYSNDAAESFLRGMGKVGEKVIMLLETDKILSTEDMTVISENV